MVVAYGIQFLDKITLGYASVYGIQTDLGLVGQDYSWASSIFSFGYLFWEYPAIYLLRYFSAPKYLGIMMMLCAIVIILYAVTPNFAGLAAIRFILGMLDKCGCPLFPTHHCGLVQTK